MTPTDSRIRILLVEDDLDQAHLVKFLLEAGGDYSVTLAQDGDRALALLPRGPWAIVITDLNLPGADGNAVVEAARSSDPTLPILATTGYTGPEYAQRAAELGADAVLVKPLDRDDLLTRVRDLLSRPRDEPTRPRPATNGRQVLAIGVRPGDAEGGCGGTLHRHRLQGDQVVILHLGAGGPDEDQARRREAAWEAGNRLGARAFVGNAASDPGTPEAELERLAAGAVREIRPDVLYLPSATHAGRAHGIAHRAAAGAAQEDVVILAYDPGDLPPTFTPTWFSVVDGTPLEQKLAGLREYTSRDVLLRNEEEVRLHAAYWGRHSHGRPAEPFERIGNGPPPLEGITLTLPETP